MKTAACLLAAITISNTVAAYDMPEIQTYTKKSYSVLM